MTTKLITADHYAATTQAVEAAIAASLAGETVTIECLSASTRLDVEAELSREADDIRGDVYSGEAFDGSEDADDDADDDAMVRWTVRVTGGEDEIVTIEEMPEHLQESHRAAGNWGVYPTNGAERRRVLRDEAEEIVAADPYGYARIV